MSAPELAPDPEAERKNRRRPEPHAPDEDGTALDAPISPAEVVELYRAAEGDIRRGFSLIAGALDTLTERVSGKYAVRLEGRYGHGINVRDVDGSLSHLRRDIWRALIERSQVRKIMSVAAWKELETEVEKGEPPDVTLANLEGLINKLRADGPKMLEDAVKEVFHFLRPPRSHFKTNTEFELGERVILSYWLESGKFVSGWRLNYHYEQEAVALENVFRLLDGKVRRADDGYWSDLHNAIKLIPGNQSCVGETDYFAFRGHKKGTLHLRFKRMDLVRRLNVIAGGARLKPVGT